MADLHTEIQIRFRNANRVLIVSHVRPDADAIGSMLALGLALQDTGKQVQMVLSDGVPSSLKFLPGSEQVRLDSEGEFDLVVTVDCSELKRTGDALGGRPPDLVIDHHITTEHFGNVNLIEPAAVATASILTKYLPEWGFPITASMAANLLAGLITDTLGFRTSNITPEALHQAATLMELGADMNTLYYHALIRRTFTGAKYWGAGLSSLSRADGIIWSTLTLADRKNSGYTGNDDADLINIVSSIDEADIAIMFVEQNKAKTKISWRGLKPHVDVAFIAVQFGGGGHKAAAGAEVNGSLSEVQEKVLSATKKALENQTK
jgi:phosphoesterase RecJ-like protein